MNAILNLLSWRQRNDIMYSHELPNSVINVNGTILIYAYQPLTSRVPTTSSAKSDHNIDLVFK